MSKIAIVNCGHPGSYDSLALMLRAVGWEVRLPDDRLRTELKREGCDTVLDPVSMADGWGGNLHSGAVQRCSVSEFERCGGIFVCVKGHRNGPKVERRWPQYKNRILWYRINGARPCIVPGKGDELNPPCSVLTPDPWYDAKREFNRPELPEYDPALPHSTLDRSYSAWPPFAWWGEFQGSRGFRGGYDPPVCLVHNLSGWGYGEVGDRLAKSVRLKRFGGYGSPDGLLPMQVIPSTLSRALCYVHLKSQDCPGYSLYEALSAACPVVVSRAMIDWCHMEPLFEEGVTCLCFDARLPKGYGASGATPPIDAAECAREAAECVERLRDPELNRRIGEAGRDRLRSIMWDGDSVADVEGLDTFLQRFFP